jgi:hypothetical protein
VVVPELGVDHEATADLLVHVRLARAVIADVTAAERSRALAALDTWSGRARRCAEAELERHWAVLRTFDAALETWAWTVGNAIGAGSAGVGPLLDR